MVGKRCFVMGTEKTYDPASVHETDKEERPKKKESVNELSATSCAPGLMQKPEKQKFIQVLQGKTKRPPMVVQEERTSFPK